MAIRTPLKAIRAKCLDCTNNQIVEVRDCPITDCPLYEYRMGHNPSRKGKGNANALLSWREKQKGVADGENINE